MAEENKKTNIEGEKKKAVETIKEKTEEKKVEEKKEVKKEKPILKKKTVAFVNMKNLPISTKHSIAICSFIRGKKIEDAIADLEAVLKLKKAVPMKGEIPHRKGKGIAGGRFPKNASERFLKLLKSLFANANHEGLEEPIIVEAVANIGERPYGRFGHVRKKRTHVLIKAKSLMKKGDKK